MTRRTNWARAEEGLRLTNLMEKMTGVDELRDQISDALCHLMHTCRLVRDEEGEPISFAECLDNAVINFSAECEEDPDE